MGYSSRRGRRPPEFASKASHGHVIRSEAVQDLLARCTLPKRADEVEVPADRLHPFREVRPNPVRHVIAVDGGSRVEEVRKGFPSSQIAFFQFGALVFDIADLEALDEQPFIDPDDMARLKQIRRLELALPIRNVGLKDQPTLTHSVRRALYDFFRDPIDGVSLMETLEWLVFERFNDRQGGGVDVYNLATDPHTGAPNLALPHAAMKEDHTWDSAQGTVYLTDVFRLHEKIDDELGAGGIVAYVLTAIEQLVLAHVIRLFLWKKPSALRDVLFVKDGPLAFFGQTANLHKPMRALVRHLLEHHQLYLVGLEKSGPFVEHADEIAAHLDPGTALVLGNDYIYRNVLPASGDPASPYGRTTYYGAKLLFKTPSGAVHVATIPTPEALVEPAAADLPNLDVLLTNVEKLRCDMYDNALIPVALANKLVSLADHPSSRILQRFASGSVSA